MITIQEALAYGERLCFDEGLPVTRKNIVWELMCEAAQTEQSQPDRELAWLLSADRSGMPEVMHTEAENAEEWGAQVQRVGIGEEVKDMRPARSCPSNPAIDRAEVVMHWFRYVPGKGVRAKRRNREILLSLAKGCAAPGIAKMVGFKSYNSVYAARDRSLDAVVAKVYGLALSETQPVDTLCSNGHPSVHA